ncbi:MAG: hypothetical protein AB8H47_02370, partial [Bacteroidia bacterium]
MERMMLLQKAAMDFQAQLNSKAGDLRQLLQADANTIAQSIGKKHDQVIDSIKVIDGGTSWDFMLDLGDVNKKWPGLAKGEKKDVAENDADLDKNKDIPKEEKAKMIKEGLKDLHAFEKQHANQGAITYEEAQKVRNEVRKKHSVFTSFKVELVGKNWNYIYTASPPSNEVGAAVDRPVLNENTVLEYGSGSGTGFPITQNKSGSKSTVPIPGWEHAEKLNHAKGPDKKGVHGRKGDWVKGHIISHRLGGKGSETQNLFIIDRSANGQMVNAESKAEGLLQTLINLEDEQHDNFNKVLYYNVLFDNHGVEAPLYGNFAREISIEWGLKDLDGNGVREKNEISFEIAPPPREADDITYNINRIGWETFYKISNERNWGIKAAFAQNLTRIRKGKNYVSMEDIEERLIENHNKSIAISTVESQLELLNGILDGQLNLK